MICVRLTFADWHVCFRCQCNFADVYHANKVLLHVFRPWVKFFSSTTILLIAFWCDTQRIPKAFFTPPIIFSFSDSRSCNREGSVHLCQGRTLLFLNFHGPLPLSSGGKCGCEAGLEHEWWSQRLFDANLLCLQVHMKAHRLTWPESCRTTYKPELQMNLNKSGQSCAYLRTRSNLGGNRLQHHEGDWWKCRSPGRCHVLRCRKLDYPHSEQVRSEKCVLLRSTFLPTLRWSWSVTSMQSRTLQQSRNCRSARSLVQPNCLQGFISKSRVWGTS